MSILAVAFVGWLVFEGINDMRGGNVGGDINPVVGEVAGNDIRYNDWNSFHQNQLAVMRQTGRVMTDEDLRIVENQAWESLINATLLEGELDRLGIHRFGSATSLLYSTTARDDESCSIPDRWPV